MYGETILSHSSAQCVSSATSLSRCSWRAVCKINTECAIGRVLSQTLQIIGLTLSSNSSPIFVFMFYVRYRLDV